VSVSFLSAKDAVTARVAVATIVQVSPDVVSQPDQPVSVDEASGFATSVTASPYATFELHELVHAAVSWLAVTLPDPVPLRVTSIATVDGGAMMAMLL
jgi:hypothetical protein